MHLAQCGSSLYLDTSLDESLHASRSVWIIILLDTRLREPLHATCSTWIISFLRKKARRATTCILFGVDHRFNRIQGYQSHYMHRAQCRSLLSMEKRLGEPLHASC
jgi:hypothetical protein